MDRQPFYSRRALSRTSASEEIWVCWNCNGRDDISRVLDLSSDGLFLEISKPKASVGMPAKVDFLVDAGRIRADAVICHVRKGAGLGLKFTAFPSPDLVRLKSLISRLRAS